jgi:photosystem II stability/assembly factor-like uncharacterized protein
MKKIFLLGHLITCYAAILSGQWTSLGPTGAVNTAGYPNEQFGSGRCESILYRPGTPSTVYVGTSAGYYKSTNGAASFSKQDNGAIPNFAMFSIAISTQNPNTHYAIAKYVDYKLYKSTDDGVSWSLVLDETLGDRKRVLVNPNNDNQVFVSSGNGVRISNDGGATWSTILGGNVISDIALKPALNSGYLLYATTELGTDLYLYDGSTLSSVPGIIAGYHERLGVTAADQDLLYIIMDSNIMKYTTGDAAVTDMGNPSLIGFMASTDVAVSPADENMVFFNFLPLCCTYTGDDLAYPCYGSNYHNGIFTYVHADIRGIAFRPDGQEMLVACDGGIFKTNPTITIPDPFTGTSFVPEFWDVSMQNMDSHQPFTVACHPTNPNIMYTGSLDNGTFRRNNAGVWEKFFDCDAWQNKVNPLNPNHVFYAFFAPSGTTDQRINVSFNGGAISDDFNPNNSISFSRYSWNRPIEWHPSDENILFTATDNGIQKSTWSSTWTHENLGPLTASGFSGNIQWPNINQFVVAPSNPSVIYCVLDLYNYVFKTTDGGQNWTAYALSETGFRATHMTVHPTNPDEVWICFDATGSSQIQYSSNGGQTWAEYATGLPSLAINDLIIDKMDSDLGRYVATDNGVYYRNSTSASWSVHETGLPQTKVTDLDIFYGSSYPNSAKIRAAIWGRGVWEAAPAQGSPLPLSLTAFSARAQEADNLIEWQTASEQNPVVFEVERSEDTKSFVKIGSVLSSNGATNHAYRFVDPNVHEMLLYYRLKSVDLDGAVNYSRILTVYRSPKLPEIRVWPSPTQKEIFTQLPGYEDEHYSLTICSESGKIVLRQNALPYRQQIAADVSQLPRGVYFIHVYDEHQQFYNSAKFIKN